MHAAADLRLHGLARSQVWGHGVTGWTITPDRRRPHARMDEVWLRCPALSHAREPRTAHRRYPYDIAQVAHAPMVGWYGPHHRPVAARLGPTGRPIRSRCR